MNGARLASHISRTFLEVVLQRTSLHKAQKILCSPPIGAGTSVRQKVKMILPILVQQFYLPAAFYCTMAVAGDRLVNNGDAQIGFWFFQNGTAPVVTQPGNIQNFAPPKKVGPGAIVGDILVLADFTGGGRDAGVTVLEWVGTGGNYSESDAFNLLSVGAAVAENNAGPTPVPTCGWGYPTTSYDINAFFEGYIDLASIGAASVCFSRAMLEGRSSQEITASLDDFVGGPLGSVPNCSISGSNTICAGTSTCFTATGGSGSFTYSWSGPNGFSASGAQICNLTANGTYNVTVSNATGCTSGCSRTLTVNQAPVCNITGNNTICSYQTATFTATGGSSYSWSGPASFTASSAVISNLTAQGTYNVTVTSSAGCTSTCSRTLTVNNPPSCNVTGNNTICSGGSTSFTATGGGTYAWSGPAGFTAGNVAVISNLTAQGTYNVTVTSAQGCTSSCSRTLTVNTTPTCNITGNNTICSYQTATFTATGGSSYSWAGPAGFTANSAIISNLTAQGTYNVTVTASGGCTSTCSRTLTVNEPPSCNITGNNTICVGNTATFTATGGGSYAWSGPAGFTAGNVAVISNLTAQGTYNVTVTSAAGCTSSCSRTLTVNPNPTVDAGNPPAAQCRNASIVGGAFVFGTNTFSVTGTMNNAQSPVWTVAPGGNPNGYTVGFSAANSLTTNVNISGNVNGGTVTVRLTVQSNQTPSCGSAFDDVTLTINALPDLKVVIGSDFCPNVTTTGSVTLQNSQLLVSYQLKDDADQNVQAPKAGTGGDLVWTGLAPGNYTVVGSFATNCNSRSGPAPVIENPVPEVSITPVEQLCTDANCVTLAASPAGGSFSGTGVSNGQFCPGGLAPGSYTVRYTYTNSAGCTASSSISIDVVSCGEPLCTYTQGAYGNAGGQDCDGTTLMSTTALINQSIAHWGGTLTVGCGTNKVTISTGQASCVIARLPGGGPSTELSGTNTICQLPNERINNTLLAQTITLGLNIGITSPSTLSDFALQAGTLSTAGLVGGCGTDVAEPRICHYDPITHLLTSVENEYVSRSFSQALIDAIVAAGYPATVGGLFSLANDALCNKDGVVGTERGVSLSEIAGGAGSINEVFDECRVPQGWNVAPCPPSDLPPVPRITVGSIGESPFVENLKVSVFPNPYRDNVRFVIQSPVAGQAVLDVYNIAGQKVQTLFSGHIDANETRIVDFKPGLANAMMIYQLRVGNRQVTGKLVGLKE
jgi:hypothetical protein